MGVRLVSFTVTEEAIADPALDALPRTDLDRIAAISQEMCTRPAAHVAELELLAARHSHIPMLWNHLAGALEAAGERERAERIIADTARRFPRYVFAFCSFVMALLARGEIDEARTLVETGPRGPVFVLTDFDPSRAVFHVSEVSAHAAMVGHYMLAAGRPDAARVQLTSLRRVAPRSPQAQRLAEAIKRHKTIAEIADMARWIQAEADRRSARKPRRRRGES